MKKILIISLAFFLMGCLRTYVNLKPHEKIVRVIHFPEKKRVEIYENTLIWIAKNFRDAKKDVLFQDKKNGFVVVKGMSSFGYAFYEVDYQFKADFNFSQNRVKIEFYDLVLHTGNGSKEPFYTPYLNKVKGDIDRILHHYEKNLFRIANKNF